MTAAAPPPGLLIEARAFEDPDSVALVVAVQQEYVERYGGPDETPIEPGAFAPPAGAFYVGYLDGAPVASGAWRRVDGLERLGRSQAAEVKRMYVVPSARRRGLARLMLAHLEATARDAGADVMVLETGTMQPEAIALYRAVGYTPVDGFGHYRCAPESRYYARTLGPPPGM